MPLSASRRTLCSACLRPSSACICTAVQRIPHQVQVLILMHPLEVHQAKGTARLLHLCLPESRILVGETFEPPSLQQWLHAPWPEEGNPEKTSKRQTLLLYPPTPDDGQHSMQPPAVWPDESMPPLQPAQLRLVVLDGTWRKSRKMLWLNPALQRLPRLALNALPDSRYAIRKAHAAHQRSTLEATHLALRQLEPDNPELQQLGLAMDTLMQLQQRFFPAR